MLLGAPTTASDLSFRALQMLVITLVLSRLDYGNAVLVGLPAYLMHRLQSCHERVSTVDGACSVQGRSPCI